MPPGAAARLRLGAAWLFPLGLMLVPAVASPAEPGASRFAPITDLIAPPSATRGVDGRPTAQYWQQRITYDIDARLDVERKSIVGRGQLGYTNNAPQVLDALWFELTLAGTAPDAIAHRSATIDPEKVEMPALAAVRAQEESKAGFEIQGVADDGGPLPFEVRGTQLRVGLRQPLASGETVRLKLGWRVALSDLDRVPGRSGYMLLADGQPVFHAAQWYPQPVAFTDYGGWRNVPFVDQGEFAPEFGDYDVRLTLPAGQIVAATGTLANEAAILSGAQRTRLAALRSGQVTEIVTAAEAVAKQPSTASATWRFTARNVRDFGFAASLRYRWDATLLAHSPVRAMTFYPPEAAPLWRPFALPAMAHGIEVYSRMTFDYPYPVVQAAFGPNDGMEHPMLAFSRYPPDGADGKSYSRDRKREFLWVLIHEVGHNWFPMVVNSDERAWTWMDEGINSYLETLATLEWSADYATRPNVPAMLGEERAATAKLPPMTPANAVVDLFPTQYHRPAAAIQVLRELVLGRETFDRAFRAYAKAWMFKRPTPGDFFRTISQESGADLDWFWRGWFFSTGQVDLALERVSSLRLTAVPATARIVANDAPPANITTLRNAAEGRRMAVERMPALADCYDLHPAPPQGTPAPSGDKVAQTQRELDALQKSGNFYELDIANRGGLVTPVPIRIDYRDGSTERYVIPVEIWFGDVGVARHILWRVKPIGSVTIDPDAMTGDIDRSNNGGAVAPQPAVLKVQVRSDPTDFCRR